MNKQWRLILDSVLLGVVGALGAQLFVWMLGTADHFFLGVIAGYRSPAISSAGQTTAQVIGAHGLWLVPVAIALGGLISGALVYTFAPEAEGHGTDTAVKSFHRSGGYLRARIPLLKMVSSAITIGSGGSAGREGPTALISAGFGSVYGTFTKRPDAQRRLLVLVGMAAGLSAIFRSPIGTAIFAIEVLYSDMEIDAGALIYTMLGAVVAYTVNALFVGWKPLFVIPTQVPQAFTDYIWFVVLGSAAGIVAAFLPSVFYGIRDAFHAIPIPPHVKPALGALGVGIIALWLPEVLGGGYGWIQKAIQGQIVLKIMVALIFMKLLAFALTVSSGGSGGVFAPTLFVGAMVGGTMAVVFHQHSSVFAVIGMAALFGAAARVPIATILMVTEMTGGYHLLAPAALAVTVSYMVQWGISRRFKYPSLYEAQVPTRADSPAHRDEQVASAIHLLNSKDLSLPASIGHFDLKALLASGIPVDLPNDAKLALGVVRSKSGWVGKPLETVLPPGAENPRVIAVFRDEATLLPFGGLVLEEGDRLLAIASGEGYDRFSSALAPPPRPETKSARAVPATSGPAAPKGSNGGRKAK